MTTLYPHGYQRELRTLEWLKAKYSAGMHPEMNRRFWPWLESEGGHIGIGSGPRACPSNVSEASMRCESFHQRQPFASGIVAWSAFDLVARNGVQVHRAPTWAEMESAPAYGLHAFIGKDTPQGGDDESWHVQCIEMRGYASWVNRGRPDPQRFPLPTDPPPPIGDRLVIDKYVFPGPGGNGYRLFDSRDAGSGQAPKVDGQRQFILRDPLAAEVEAKSVVVNVTVTEPDRGGYVSAWGHGVNPGTSKVNWTVPTSIANEVETNLSAFGTFEIFASCPLHLVIDVVKYGV